MEKPAVFIVEDEAIVAADIREALLGLGYRVTGVEKSGEAALERIQQDPPDLVLMDIRLAGTMDGVEAAGRIHVLCHVPVVYLTAWSDQELLDRAKTTEPYGYILKPYSERELHSVIEMALYKHRSERELRRRDAILLAVSSAIEWLLRISHRETAVPETPGLDPGEIREILEPLGMAVETGAIGIFRHRSDGRGMGGFSLIYEWDSPDHKSCMYLEDLRTAGYAEMGLARWYGLFMKGDTVTGTVSALPEGERRIFTLMDARAGVILPIFIEDSLWGFMGFFDPAERGRSAHEIEALRITANLIGAGLGYG